MPISVLVNGAFGRMGQITVKAIEADPRFALVGQTGRDYDLKQAIRDSDAEVVVDFTHPDVVYKNALAIIDAGAHPVIGTTGLTPKQVHELDGLCAKQKRGGLVAPNFSLGAILMMRAAKEIIKYMPHVEIIEMHHDEKADSPSGTALRIAEILSQSAPPRNCPQRPRHETVPGSRGANCNGIAIHAVRLPGLLAHERILFGQTGETLSLHHDSIDRKCFMPGLCLACEKVVGLDHLVYGLEELI